MYGTDQSWVASTPALPNAGAYELAAMGAEPTARPQVGGADWTTNTTEADAGLTWLATGDPGGGQPVGAPTRAMLDDWRNLFNPHSPSFWLGLSLLVVVGLLHLRVNTKLGPAHGNIGVG